MLESYALMLKKSWSKDINEFINISQSKKDNDVNIEELLARKTKEHEQLLNRAVVWNGDFNPKKRSNSIFAKLSV